MVTESCEGEDEDSEWVVVNSGTNSLCNELVSAEDSVQSRCKTIKFARGKGAMRLMLILLTNLVLAPSLWRILGNGFTVRLKSWR